MDVPRLPFAPAVLVLGGTAEGRALAEDLDADGWAVTTSLAGRTSSPVRPHGAVRVGGFGGVDGLVRWLRAERPRAVVDATHPFAATMSEHAVAACAAAGVPLLRLSRPSWRGTHPDAGEWTWVADHAAAAAAAAAAASAARLLGSPLDGVLLTVGRQDTPPYVAALGQARVIARVAEARDLVVPACWRLLTDRGPFALEAERRLLVEHRVGVLVSKDSGGAATAAKVDAARDCGVPVVMVARPPVPAAPAEVTDVAAAQRWCARWSRASGADDLRHEPRGAASSGGWERGEMRTWTRGPKGAPERGSDQGPGQRPR